MGVIEARRRILLNQPHLETFTTQSDTFTKTFDFKQKLESFKLKYSFVQEGSGDPSPENVRNIKSYAPRIIVDSGTPQEITYTIPGGSSLSSGVYDFINGHMIYDHITLIISQVPSNTNISVKSGYVQVRFNPGIGGATPEQFYINWLKPTTGSLNAIWLGRIYNGYIYATLSVDLDSIEKINNYLDQHNLTVAYPVTPSHYYNSTINITLPTGTHEFQTNATDGCEISYWKH